MLKNSRKTIAALFMSVLALCLAPTLAFADDQIQPLQDGQQANTSILQAASDEETATPPTVQTPQDPKPEGSGTATETVKTEAKATEGAVESGKGEQNLSAQQSSGPEQTLSAASSPEKADPSISYAAHVQNIGWQKEVSDGELAGTSGQSLRMEAIRITIDKGDYDGSLQMKAHVQNIGWQNILVDNGGSTTLGTSGRSLRVEAIRLALTGDISRYFDIYYQAHVQNIGWQKEVSNGELAGTTGQSLRIEAIRISLRKKQTPAAQEGNGIIEIHYQAHVQRIGWQNEVTDGGVAGTSGQSLRVEALKIWVDAGSLSGNIEYRAHVQNVGWQNWVKNGAMCGSTGQSLRIEAIDIRLTGQLAELYDVVYNARVQNIGWQPNKNNSRDAGTTGQSLRVEALTIRIVSKANRNGWFNDSTSWNYYTDGSMATSKWVESEESPIDANPGTRRYWVDSSGNLAVSRMINPANAADASSGYKAYATGSGYVVRNQVFEYEGGYYWADSKGRLETPDTPSLIEAAVRWAVNIANDDSHGYSQANRWGPDYDCSSFVISAFESVGFNCGNATYTGNMVSEMTQHGFVWHSGMSGLRRGDIVLVHSSSRQHTEIYLGYNQLVGAHCSENGGIYGQQGDQTGGEICIGDYFNAPWQGYLRAVL